MGRLLTSVQLLFFFLFITLSPIPIQEGAFVYDKQRASEFLNLVHGVGVGECAKRNGISQNLWHGEMYDV